MIRCFPLLSVLAGAHGLQLLDLAFVGLAVAFFVLSAWFVTFCHELMPSVARGRGEDAGSAGRGGDPCASPAGEGHPEGEIHP